MSKKHKRKPSPETLAHTERELRRLEAGGWLKFHGFREKDGFAKVEASSSLVMLQLFTGYPFEVVVAGLIHALDKQEGRTQEGAAITFKDIQEASQALKIGPDEPLDYV